ncbi:MAG: hypothetical protein QM785_01265 [Pyrinomonadaceae bacterium]
MKKSIAAMFAAAVLFGLTAMPSSASATTAATVLPLFQDNCVVTGNNNTPLRVRSAPNGRILGSLKVGSQIKAWGLTQDRSGVDWTKISWKKGYAWVATEFISCG